jgi:hypothetical protein
VVVVVVCVCVVCVVEGKGAVRGPPFARHVGVLARVAKVLHHELVAATADAAISTT